MINKSLFINVISKSIVKTEKKVKNFIAKTSVTLYWATAKKQITVLSKPTVKFLVTALAIIAHNNVVQNSYKLFRRIEKICSTVVTITDIAIAQSNVLPILTSL